MMVRALRFFIGIVLYGHNLVLCHPVSSAILFNSDGLNRLAPERDEHDVSGKPDSYM